jgi:hypothetical protein
LRLALRPLRGLAGIVVAAALILGAPSSVAADAVEVVSLGWDGTVVPGTWSPVRVRVTGLSADLTARVEVVVKFRPPSPGPPVTLPDQVVGVYGQDVALPAGTTKEITLWVPSPGQVGSADPQPGTVRLVADGRIVAEQGVEFRSGRTTRWPLVGVLAEAPTIQRSVAAVSVPYQGLPVPVNMARLSSADVPTAAERLRAFAGIVVQGAAPAVLTAEQRQAVRDWVAAGGHLVVTGGPDAARAAAVLPSGSLPIAFGGTSSASDLAPLARWLGNPVDPVGSGPSARLEPRDGAILAGTGDSPLVWRLGLGDGTVTVLAADPGLEPLASWVGTPALVQRLLEPALANFPTDGNPQPMGYVSDPTARLQSAVDTLPAEAYPSWALVLFILGGFALAAGPVAHVVLRRLDRREWAWAVVPAMALLLVAALYVVGIGRDGRDVLANVVGHVRIRPEEGGARAALAAGYFSPTRQRLTVQVPGLDPVRPMGGGAGLYGYGYPYGYSGSMPATMPSYYGFGGYSSISAYAYGGTSAQAGDEAPFSVVSGRDTRIEYASGQWGMRTLALERSLGSEVGQLSAHLRLEGGLVTGAVRNDTPFLLEDAAIVAGSSFATLGTLAPGQTAPLVLDTAAGGDDSDPASAYRPLSYRLLGASSGQPGAGAAYPPGAYSYGGPGSDFMRDPERARRARLLDAITQSYGPYGSTNSRPLSLLAFTRSPLGVPVPTAGSHPLYSLSVVEQRLNLEFEPGPFALPAALTPSEMLPDGYSMGSGPGGPSAKVTYEFRPPLPRGALVHALELTAAQNPAIYSQGPGGYAPVAPQAIPPGQTPPAETPTATPQAGSPVPAATPQGRFPAPPTGRVRPPNFPGSPGDLTVAVYNWRSGGWDAMPPTQRTVRIESPESYVGAEGQVRVQVSGTPGPMQLTGWQLAVEGSVPG